MTPLSGLPAGVDLHLLHRLHHPSLLYGLCVDQVLSLALLRSLDALAGDIPGPVAGLEVVTVDQTTWIPSGH